MALEDILRKIREDAEAEAAKVLAAARADEERLLAQGRAKAQAAAERIDAAGAAAAEDARRRELATASVEIRRIVLSAKQEILESVFENALDQLASLPDGEYGDLLADLACRAASAGDEMVVVSARDRARLGSDWLALANARLQAKGLPGNLVFAPATREIRGGLILVAGSVEINASFERTLASMRETLEPEIAAMLFGQVERGSVQ